VVGRVRKTSPHLLLGARGGRITFVGVADASLLTNRKALRPSCAAPR
jgi:hypothetical protein